MHKTLGIVLHTIKYSDTSIIARIFTRELGYKSFILKGIRSKKSKKLGLMQPFSLLEMDVKFSQKSDLGWIKEFNLSQPTHSITTDVAKSCIVFFLAELLVQTLENDYQNEELFDFIHQSVLLLEAEEHPANFHLWFMLSLTKFYGFYPQQKQATHHIFFNLVKGEFVENLIKKQHTLDKETSLILHEFLGMVFEEIMAYKLSSQKREKLLNALLVYFQVHVEGMKKLKSQEILNTIFS